MKRYTVLGMSCEACVARVERAVSQVEGVSTCAVSLLTNSMGVEGSASDEAIIQAVEKAGYSASAQGNENSVHVSSAQNEDVLADHETPKLKRRLITSLCFLLPLMYLSMGYSMWGWPLPSIMEQNPLMVGILQMLLSSIVLVINQKFFISGTKSLLNGSPNMDTLVSLGSAASYAYSLYLLLRMTETVIHAGTAAAHEQLHSLYFESAAMILTLITVGKMLEARSKGKTTNALKSLMQLAPKTAILEVNGKEVFTDIENVVVGDIFIVKPGDRIPVDGVIIEGTSAVDESALTGESMPVDKTKGDRVSTATINKSGFLRCKATQVGKDTTLSQIIKMVSDVSLTKAPIAKIADKVSGVFVPVVIAIAFITFVVWMLVGRPLGYSLARAISVLVISCPCALGLATPVAIMVGNGKAAKEGILFKTASSLEMTGRTEIVVLDKTGTITQGQPRVTDIVPNGEATKEELLKLAYSLEKHSEHPLAKSIVLAAEELSITPCNVTDFEALPGNGLKALLNGSLLIGGNYAYIAKQCTIPSSLQTKAEAYAADGKTPLFFLHGERLLGMIAVADTTKPDSAGAISQLKNMGLHVVMLTGDNARTANAIAKQCRVDEVISDVLPSGKEAAIRKLKKRGKVAMVGDGINDAPALTTADIGIAIGAGAGVAIDAADVVLINSNLSDVPAAIRISRATLRTIHQNLFWAFCYNVIGIPVAAGAFISLFGWQLNPMFGAAAMSLSSFCVVSNALRLNLFDMRDAKKDKKIQKTKEKKKMEKTMKINGMMCKHCSGRVQKALEALPEVDEAIVSHENGTAVLTLNKPVDDALLKQTVEAEGYEVVG